MAESDVVRGQGLMAEAATNGNVGENHDTNHDIPTHGSTAENNQNTTKGEAGAKEPKDAKSKNAKQEKKEKKGRQEKKKKEAKEKPANVQVNTIDKEYDLAVRNNITGRQLFDKVVQELGITELWFFGLQFTDAKGNKTWLKLKKKVFSQDVGKARPIKFSFLVKFYPEDVQKELISPSAQMQFFLQVRESIVSSSVFCPPDTAVLLAALSQQVQHGDYRPESQHTRGFLTDEHVLPESTLEAYELTAQQWEDKIVTFYKDLVGTAKEKAVMEYLRIAQDLEMFGINYFDIRNKKGTELTLGVDAMGLNVYERDNKLTPKIGFPWNEIRAISFHDKKFIIKPVDDKGVTSSPHKLHISKQTTRGCCSCTSASQYFAFYTHKVRTNKLILALCTGNHELYMRRRVPEQTSTLSRKHNGEALPMASATDEPDSVVQPHKEEEKNEKEKEEEDYEKEGTATTASIASRAQSPDDRQSEEPNTAMTGFDTDVSSHGASPVPPQYSDVMIHNDHDEHQRASSRHTTPLPEVHVEEVSSLEEEKVTFSEEEEDDLEQQERSPSTRPVSPPGATSRASPRPPTASPVPPGAPSPRPPSTMDEPPREPEEHVQGGECKEEEDEAEREETEKDLHSDNGEMELHWDMGKERPSSQLEDMGERQLEIEKNKEIYSKLVHLYENLSKKETGKHRRENHLHKKMRNAGAGPTDTKYKTIKKIREGNTKERISIFEAM